MKFRKKPIVIEAMKYYSGEEDKIIYWAHSELHPSTNSIITKDYGPTLKIRTLEGYNFSFCGSVSAKIRCVGSD